MYFLCFLYSNEIKFTDLLDGFVLADSEMECWASRKQFGVIFHGQPGANPGGASGTCPPYLQKIFEITREIF
jgi:hypothetical protein